MTSASTHPPLPQEAAEKLLDLLSSDDTFRDAFTQDPASALAQIGLDSKAIEAALVHPSCLETTNLASKEEIREARDELMEHLIGVQPHLGTGCFDSPAH